MRDAVWKIEKFGVLWVGEGGLAGGCRDLCGLQWWWLWWSKLHYAR